MKRHEIRERANLGGKGSGHHGHKGIPGQRGGSAPRGGGATKLFGGSVEVRGSDEFVALVQDVLGTLPEWQRQQVPRDILSAINRDRIGIIEIEEEYLDKVDHPLLIRELKVGEGSTIRGSMQDNVIDIEKTADIEGLRHTIYHEMGHHVDALTVARRNIPEARTHHQLAFGSEKLESATMRALRDLEFIKGRQGAGSAAYKEKKEQIALLTKTARGRYVRRNPVKQKEVFAQAFAAVAMGQGDTIPRTVAKSMAKYLRATPPKSVLRG